MSTLFLFGSGADTDCCKELKSGQSFSEALLSDKYDSELKSLLGDDACNFKLLYPASTKVFIQTVVTFEEKALKALDKNDVDNCLAYNKDRKNVDFDKVIRPMCSKWYKLMKDKNKNNKEKDFFLNNSVFFDSLDERFNSLRYSELNDNARRVISAYYTIFILMMKSLYKLEDFEWNYPNIFNKLKQKYDAVCNDESYYTLLEKSGIASYVVTTNYTNLAENLTKRTTSYLHGKLIWFEDLVDLSVYDCLAEQEKKHLLSAKRKLPFILIPSGVKPIICTKQIEQFSQFIENLKSTTELCVIGYKFNSEDNHINSIIGEWLKKGNNRMVYFNFVDCPNETSNDHDSPKNGVDFEKLACLQEFPVKSIDYSPQKIEKSNGEKIYSITIDRNNSHEAFSEYLNLIKESQTVQ